MRLCAKLSNVLPALETSLQRQRRERARRAFAYKMVLCVGLLMAYIFGIGLAMLNGTLRPDAGLFWMALPCLVPTVWYGYGFLQVSEREQDWGLILSALGWALIAIALCIQASALRSAWQNAAPDASFATVWAATGTLLSARLASIVALLCLLAGLGLSWHAWNRQRPPAPDI